MTAPRFLASSALRLATAFAVIFALGGALMFGAFQWAVTGYANASIEEDLRVETRVLLADQAASDLPGLERRVSSRTRLGSPFSYALFDRTGRRLAGALPLQAPQGAGLGQVAMPAPTDDGAAADEPILVRTLATPLPDGSLVVGKTTYAVHELQEWMAQIALWGAAGMAVLAALGGLTAGLILARRLERVNTATARIMQGHLTERLPPIGLGSEFAALRDNLNRMLERLEASMEAMRHVSSDIAHDLRTPLNRMRQRLEQSRARSETVQGLQEAIDRALTDLDGALDIFAALLRIAQIEAGAGREAFAPVPASALIRRVFDAYQPVVDEAGHTMALLADSEKLILGDEDLLIQMLSNLVENAIVHANGPIHIILEAYDDRTKTVLCVRDTGTGIPDEAVSRVTRRFYRLDHSRHSPGAGLGLALVAAIASLHDADLALGSNRPGLSVRLTFVSTGETGGAGNGSEP
jgi:signal transduction histidine kinase